MVSDQSCGKEITSLWQSEGILNVCQEMPEHYSLNSIKSKLQLDIYKDSNLKDGRLRTFQMFSLTFPQQNITSSQKKLRVTRFMWDNKLSNRLMIYDGIQSIYCFDVLHDS